MGAISWTISLVDKVSGPAAKINPILQSFDNIAGKVGGVYGAAAGFASSIAGVGMGAANLAIDFGKAAIEVGSFRENTLMSFEVLLKSKSAAKSVYDEAMKLAGVTPFETADVVKGYKNLVAVGFAAEDLKGSFTDIGDMAFGMGGGAELADSLIKSFGKIKAAGKLTGGEIASISEAGLSSTLIFDKVAQKIGKTREETMKMQAAGQISAEDGLAGIRAAMHETFGGMMDKASQTFTGKISSLSSRSFELFNAAFAGQGSGLGKMMAGVGKGVDFLSASLDPTSASGNKISGILNRIGGSMADVIDPAIIGTAVEKIVDLVDRFTPVFEGLFSGLKEGFAWLPEAMGGLDNIGDNGQILGMADAAKQFGMAIGSIAEKATELKPLLDLILDIAAALGPVVKLLGQTAGAAMDNNPLAVIGKGYKATSGLLKGEIGYGEALKGALGDTFIGKGASAISSLFGGGDAGTKQLPSAVSAAELKFSDTATSSKMVNLAQTSSGPTTINNTYNATSTVSGAGLSLQELTALIEQVNQRSMKQAIG